MPSHPAAHSWQLLQGCSPAQSWAASPWPEGDQGSGFGVQLSPEAVLSRGSCECRCTMAPRLACWTSSSRSASGCRRARLWPTFCWSAPRARTSGCASPGLGALWFQRSSMGGRRQSARRSPCVSSRWPAADVLSRPAIAAHPRECQPAAALGARGHQDCAAPALRHCCSGA